MIDWCKKFFVSLLIWLPLIFGISNSDYIDWMAWLYSFDVGDSFQLWDYTYHFVNNWDMYSSYWSMNKNSSYLVVSNSPYTLWVNYWRIDWQLYYYSKSSYNWAVREWFLNNWCIWENLSDCYNWLYNYSFDSVKESILPIESVVFWMLSTSWAVVWWSNFPSLMCFYDWNYYYCVSCSHSTSTCDSWLTWSSLWFNFSTFEDIPEDYWSSPFIFSTNNVPIPSSTWLDSYTYVEIWSWDYIDYYEQKEHFTEDICYIWTKDLDSNYEDRIPYYQWTWYTIFDAYSNLYNTNNLSINKVWMFLNMIYANYRSWFLWYNRDSNWNVIYNMIYSWWSIELDYSTWLVNPFLNNKAYLYFIWSTALQTPNIDVYVAWQDVALYCYYKLGNYSNDWVSLNVNDDYDHDWLDQRVAVNSKNNRTQKTFYTWANEIVWKSREWTPLEYFQQWSWFIDPSDFFNENFNKFKEVLTPLSPWDLWLWYVPWYIILFMCALILFRFLWH